MLLECMIEREGPTEIPIDGFVYLFRPDPNHRDRRPTCEVLSSYHCQRLIDSGNFREFIEDKSEESEKVEDLDPPLLHDENGRKVWKCAICDKTYLNASSLSRHKRTHENGRNGANSGDSAGPERS